MEWNKGRLALLFVFLLAFMTLLEPAKTAKVMNIEFSSYESRDVQKIEYVPGEVLVEFKPGIPTETIDSICATLGLEKISYISFVDVYHLQIASDISVEDVVAVLNLNPNVENAGPNVIKYPCQEKPRHLVTPNDPLYPNQWGLNNFGQNPGVQLGVIDADIDAPQAWEHGTTSSRIVAVLDTGTDWTHPDLAENIWQNLNEDADGDGQTIEFNATLGRWVLDPDDINGVDDDDWDANPATYIDDLIGWDFANNDNNPMDDVGHGTRVAGIIGAVGDNGEGIAGVCWAGVDGVGFLMILKFMPPGNIPDEIRAIEYAIQNGASVISCSFSAAVPGPGEWAAIERANANEILVVAAAGNQRMNISQLGNERYPVCFNNSNIIGVAASNNRDQLWVGSNYGHTRVHIAAPGENITSTSWSVADPHGYATRNGTSYAVPHVSGAIAHFWTLFPDLNHSEIKDWILRKPRVDPRPDLQNLVTCGINHDARLRMICGDDFGDAPDPFKAQPGHYPTKMRFWGGCHEDIGEEWLGYYGDVTPEFDADVYPPWDADPDFLPNILPDRVPETPRPPYIWGVIPDLELYDDGVIFLTPFVPGQIAIIAYSICTQNEDIVDFEGGRYLPGRTTTLAPDKRLYINIWIDWNQDGLWDWPFEHIWNRAHDPTLEWNGTHCSRWRFVQFLVPQNATVGVTWLRARLDYGEDVGRKARYDQDISLRDTYGLAQFGEVEDYKLHVCPPSEGIVLHAEDGLIDLWDPVCTYWEGLHPEEEYGKRYHLDGWLDNCDDILSPCDYISLEYEGYGEWYHVENVTITIVVEKKPYFNESMYIEFEGYIQDFPWEYPICTWWKEVYPYYCNSYHLVEWFDDGDGYFGYDDQILLEKKCTNQTAEYRIVELATDLIIIPKPPPEPPVANKTHSPLYPYAGETVTFDASSSYTAEGTIVSYTWNFGDNTPIKTEAIPVTTHIYTASGTYTVTLTVTNNYGLCNTHNQTIPVGKRCVGGDVDLYQSPSYTPWIPLGTPIVTIAVIAIYMRKRRRRNTRKGWN